MKERTMFLLSLLLVLPAAAWFGFVIHVEWQWFAVPLGAPRIGAWEAAGLAVLTKLLCGDLRDVAMAERETPGARLGVAAGIAFVVPLFALAFGALYHAFA